MPGLVQTAALVKALLNHPHATRIGSLLAFRVIMTPILVSISSTISRDLRKLMTIRYSRPTVINGNALQSLCREESICYWAHRFQGLMALRMASGSGIGGVGLQPSAFDETSAFQAVGTRKSSESHPRRC